MNQEETLIFYRNLIEAADQSLMETIALRLKIAKGLGAFKQAHQLPVVHPEAALQVCGRWESFAEREQLPKEIGQYLARALMDASEHVQRQESLN